MKIQLTFAALVAFTIASHSNTKLDPQIAALLERSNPVYTVPAERALQGLPIGNGVVGTMVWTPRYEGGIVYQINRVDAWAADNLGTFHPYATNTLPSLARLVVRPKPPLTLDGKGFTGALSMNQGVVTIREEGEGGAFTGRSYVAADRPVLVVDLTDTRQSGRGATVGVGQWRIPLDQEQGETIRKIYGSPKFPGVGPKIEVNEGRVVISEIFETKTHKLEFAVAVAAIAGKVSVRQQDPRSAWLDLEPDADGRIVILASATVSEADEIGQTDAVDSANRELTAALDAGLAGLNAEQTAWWNNFWNGLGTFVSLESPDGLANYMEAVWLAGLYQTAITSRGVCPPKFNGSTFLGDRDIRAWGGQYWLWNTEVMYFPLFAQNAISLIDPFYNHYWRLLPAARKDARDLWNAEGSWVPEGTVFHHKPVERTPDVIEAERAKRIGENPVFNFTSHLLTGTVKVAWMFYKRYAYTRDVEWLRDRAYPYMMEAADFYMSYFQKGEDGKYFIFPANGHEAYFGVRNGIMDLAAVRWLMPRLIDASKTLGVDEDRRAAWQEFLDNQPPFPTMNMPEARALVEEFPPDTYAPGLLGFVKGRHNGEAVRVTPTWPFEIIGPEIAPEEDVERMRRTLPTEIFGNPDVWAGYPGWSRVPIMSARLGMKDLFRGHALRNAAIVRSPIMLPVLDHEIGLVRIEVAQNLATATNEALLQSHNGLLQIFVGWPDDWNARFRLLGEGHVFVEASQQDGVREFVALTPLNDVTATLINPWPGEELVATVDGKARELAGERIPLDLKMGQNWVISPAKRPVPSVPAYEPDPEKEMVFDWQPRPGDHKPRSLSMVGDPLPHKPVSVNFGPFAPKSAEEIANHFLPNGAVNRFGANNVVPERITFCPVNGGSIATELPPGRGGKLNIAFVDGKDRDESVYLADFDIAADFTPKPSTQIGFSFRQMALHGDGIYFATVGPMPDGKAAIAFGQNGADLNLVASTQKLIPLNFALEPGIAYRLKMSVRNVADLPMRYADVTFSVAKAAEPEMPLAKESIRLNLSNDHMPDIGQAGLYFHGGFPAGSPEASGFTATNISLHSK